MKMNKPQPLLTLEMIYRRPFIILHSTFELSYLLRDKVTVNKQKGHVS